MSDPSQAVFPAWDTFGQGGPYGGPAVGGAVTKHGEGEVIAILDTGINDAAEGGYPDTSRCSDACSAAPTSRTATRCSTRRTRAA